MDSLESNQVYRVPLHNGPKVRIRVQTYADGDACFIAAPAVGEFDEPPAMNAIAALLGYLRSAGEPVRSSNRSYRFDDDDGSARTVQVPDAVIVPGGASRVRQLLLVIHRSAIAPPVE